MADHDELMGQNDPDGAAVREAARMASVLHLLSQEEGYREIDGIEAKLPVFGDDGMPVMIPLAIRQKRVNDLDVCIVTTVMALPEGRIIPAQPGESFMEKFGDDIRHALGEEE